MSARGGAHPDGGGVDGDDRSRLRYLLPAGLAVLAVVLIVVVATSIGGSGSGSRSAGSLAAILAKLPPYWTVHRGETYGQIAKKTGLSIDQLKTLNPRADPRSLLPGERLQLRLHPPSTRPKRLGPGFWTVRNGDSFGSIAAKTGESIVTLEQLNPQLKPTALQPGDRVRLRP